MRRPFTALPVFLVVLFGTGRAQTPVARPFKQVPMVPPDSVPVAVWRALHATSNLARDGHQGGNPYPRNLLYLSFRSTATQPQRQAAVDLVQGTVSGGASTGPGERIYLIQIQDDGTSGPLHAAIDTLNTFPQVYMAHAEITDKPATVGEQRPQSVKERFSSHVPEIPPDTTPAWADADLDMTRTFVKNIVLVIFADSATQEDRQAAVELVGGTVIGGSRYTPDGRGVYVLYVDDDGSGTALKTAIVRLLALPQVVAASLNMVVDASDHLPQPERYSIRGTVPARPPDSIPAWILRDSTALTADGHTHQIMEILFRPAATQADRQHAIDLIGGTVVGGLPNSDGDGYYLVFVPDSGQGTQLNAAIAKLKRLSMVDDAGRQNRWTRADSEFGQAPHQPSVPVPMVPPDSVPAALWAALHAPSNIESGPEWGVPYARNLLMLMFKSAATQQQRQSAVDLISGTVIGGQRMGAGERWYYVTIRDDGTGRPLFAAISALKALPQVQIVGPEIPPDGP